MQNDQREAVARIVELAIVRHGVPETDLEGTLDDADRILALLSARPLALGGQHSGGGLVWLDVKDAPQDGSEILLNHRTHGIIQGWFSKGEWSGDTPISPREYSGDMWILGDDLYQDEVEYGEHGEVIASGVLGWLPLNALSTIPARAETQDEKRRCDECDFHGTSAQSCSDYCTECGANSDGGGPDKCSSCGVEGHLVPACPKCGGRFALDDETAEAQDEGAAGEPVEDLWQELCERDDRTSGEEYPEMCLITFDELSNFITRAHPSPPPAADEDRVRSNWDTEHNLADVDGFGSSFSRDDRKWHLYTMPGAKPFGTVDGYDKASIDFVMDALRGHLAALKSTAAKEGEKS